MLCLRTWGFRRSGRNLKQVAKKHSGNIYTYINRPLTEAVGDSVVARPKQFLNITCYDNSYALTCAIAGLRLAPVGENVDRALWGIGPGGVGRSLFTSLIHNSLSPTHGFFDCTSLYLDGELMQTIGHIVGYFVLTAHEGEEGGSTNLRNPRQDLYKKISPGDPISRRLPYA